jgi:hypothetical protein
MPCALGSIHRHPNLPCSFVIDGEKIHWRQWDDSSKYMVRKYVVVEQSEGAETLQVEGGSQLSWFADESVPGASHKLFLSAHSNPEDVKQVQLKAESWFPKDQTWVVSASWFIIRSDSPCP